MAIDEDFKKDLRQLLNKHSVDSATETPDFILADMVTGWLNVYKEIMGENIDWHSTWSRLEDITNKMGEGLSSATERKQ